MSVPRDAAVTIVGGGAIGCAVAYHLARSGVRDIQLLEKGDLAAATSSQAAGFVGQSRTTLDRTRLAIASARLYAHMEEETGYTADWRPSGSLRIATEPARVREFRTIAAIAESVGLEVEIVDAQRAAEICPVIDPRTVVCALWVPSDGYVQPNSLTNAYASAARDLGVSICTHTPVTGIVVRNAAVEGVVTPFGAHRTEMVINAAGPWAYGLAASVGVELPIIPVRHSFFITEPVEGWHPDIPCLRFADMQVYARGEVGSILCGGFERRATSLDPRGVKVASTLLAEPDWDVLGDFASSVEAIIPDVGRAGVKAVFRGWPAFAPDGRFVVGPVPGLRGLVMAAACNAHGVSGSAGIAQHLVESISGDPSPYVQSLSPARFLGHDWNWEDSRTRAKAVYEQYYALPAESLPAA